MTEKYIPSDALFPVRFSATEFGKNFTWGIAASAFQTKGFAHSEGRNHSLWDTFVKRRRTIEDGSSPETAVEYYKRFPADLDAIREMHFKAFRFSTSWSRLIPLGSGKINPKGADYYNRLTDACLERDLEPWVTLYHRDLPQELENRGGWTNRDIIQWFSEYAAKVANLLGDRVRNWIVLNEPMAFTTLGYLMGRHAPGKQGMKNFLPAVHHAAICQAEGGRILRGEFPTARIGTSFSASTFLPARNTVKDCLAATRLETVMNRVFIETALGLGYPTKKVPVFRKIEKYLQNGDHDRLAFDFDFIGLQYYFRIMAGHSWLSPFHIREIPAGRRAVETNNMGYEIYPQGIFNLLKDFASYKGVKDIVITEAGVCLPDVLSPDQTVNDRGRINYYIKFLESVLLAQRIGVPVSGLFARSGTDGFGRPEGHAARFGLHYVDFRTQQRIMKRSGEWFRNFLAGEPAG